MFQPLQAGVFLFANLMLPLQLSRIFDYQQPETDLYRSEQSRVGHTVKQNLPAVSIVVEERRRVDERRSDDRRLKQHATFLNTRKTQGRRRSPGRRATDLENLTQYRPISLKG
jgi:hypothetical protein